MAKGCSPTIIIADWCMIINILPLESSEFIVKLQTAISCFSSILHISE